MNDGIYGSLPRENMAPEARKLRDAYNITPNAPIVQREFGYYCLERWYAEGLSRSADLREEFGYDRDGAAAIWGLGWCESAFAPYFEETIIEDRGDYELVQDFAGRHVLCFKGRRSGFMPEYTEHPVKDDKTWEENVKWRMDPKNPSRIENMSIYINEAVEKARHGFMISQRAVGGYMYLRSLIGPADLLYMFYDNPKLIHSCMTAWYNLADFIIAEHQKHVTLDEFFIAEDICYNHGPLISPDMMREFLFPYYQQLIANIKKRQLDTSRRLFFQLDTDGYSDTIIPLYNGAVGLDMLSPFETASGCDVVRTGKEYPNLIISGGIDKRELAKGREAIDRMVDRIIPEMRRRGGYIPTCDHGVPEEVSLENYRYFRKRCIELGT